MAFGKSGILAKRSPATSRAKPSSSIFALSRIFRAPGIVKFFAIDRNQQGASFCARRNRSTPPARRSTAPPATRDPCAPRRRTSRRLAVRLLRPLDLGDALADERLGDDELRLAAARLLRALEGRENASISWPSTVWTSNPIASNRLAGVLALRLLGHRVERDGVRVVDEDQVVELLVARERERLHRDALLHAAVAREADDVVIEDGVLVGVEARLRHLGGDRHADRVADRPGRAARSSSRRRSARASAPGGRASSMPSCRKRLISSSVHVGVAAEVQPGVEEHRAVPGRQHEAIAVQPPGMRRVVAERVPKSTAPISAQPSGSPRCPDCDAARRPWPNRAPESQLLKEFQCSNSCKFIRAAASNWKCRNPLYPR